MLDYRQFENYKYVSFDLFDTLIFRSFSSYKKLFEYVEYKYNFDNSKKIFNYVKKRLDAEKIARKKVNYQEISLEDIYNELPYNSITCNILKELENEIEIKSSIPNKEVIALLDKLHEHGKIIIITTDMYLSKATIEAILHKNNIYFDYFFVSGEHKKTKHRGDLFSYILNTIGIEKNNLIHIGDNEYSDYSMPKRMGIDSVLYTKEKTYFPYMLSNKDILIDHYNSLISNGYYNKRNDFREEYKIGYSVMGPVIVSFCKWIHVIKKERNLDSLLFLSREGYAIQKVYEKMYPEEKKYVRYARINKHILRLPLLTEENLSDLLKSTLKHRNKASWRYILEALNIDSLEKIELPNGDNIDSEILLKNLDGPRYVNTKKNIIKKLSNEIDIQSKLLKEYLESLGIYGKKVGLINNSYSGNGQKLLTRFVEQQGIDAKFLGIQFAANKKCKQNLGNNFVSWLNNQDNSLMAYLFERGSLIFEHLLFEPSGTSIKLDRDEFGKVIVICEQARTENQDFEKIAAFQDGLIDFAELDKNNIECNFGPYAMQYFVNLIQNPTKEDAILLGNLHDDDVDIDRTINDYDEAFNLGYLYKDGIYNRVSWVQGFLKVKNQPDILRKLFNLRLQLTYFLKKFISKE